MCHGQLGSENVAFLWLRVVHAQCLFHRTCSSIRAFLCHTYLISWSRKLCETNCFILREIICNVSHLYFKVIGTAKVTKSVCFHFLGRRRRPYIVFRFRSSYGFMFVYIYIYIYISVILQMAALTSFFTKL